MRVIDEVGQADLHRCPGDPDGADEQVHPVLLVGEHMLDLGSDFRFGVVRPSNRRGHDAALRLFAMNMADEAVLFHELFIGLRAIGCVRPDRARRIGFVEQPFAQATAFIGGGIRRAPFANKAEAAINRDVVLIAKDRYRQIDRWRAILARLGLGELERPTCVAILLAQFRGLVLPAVRDPPFLDRRLLFIGVALARRRDQLASTI